MIKKTIIELVFFGFGLVLGVYWFITTGSYFLIFAALLLGLSIGYILGNVPKFSSEHEGSCKNDNSGIKKC